MCSDMTDGDAGGGIMAARIDATARSLTAVGDAILAAANVRALGIGFRVCLLLPL